MKKWIPLLCALLLLAGCAAVPDALPETGEGTTETVDPTETEGNTVIRLLCIGDSNTYGFDPEHYGERYAEDERWTGLLQSERRAVVNRGVNGATIPAEDELPAMRALIESELPFDAVTVMLGTNDVLCGYDVQTCAERMDALLLAVQELAPEATVILISPPPTPLGDEAQHAAFARAYTELRNEYEALAARRGVEFADTEDWGIALGSDAVHFSAAGHKTFAEALDALLRSLGK